MEADHDWVIAIVWGLALSLCDGILVITERSSLSLFLRRIEITSKQVLWNESGTLVCIATEENFFILKYDAEAASKGDWEI